MELEEFLKNNKISEVKDIKYPIKKIKATQDYVMIFLDDEKIMISLEAYFKYNVKSLKGLDDNLYSIFKDDEKYLKAYRGCLRKISSKDHSVKQIRDYLYKTELDKATIDSIIDRLKEYKLLDDEKYCINKINYYNNSSLSTKQIKLKLKNDGISEELIKQHLNTNDEMEYAKALKIASKYSNVKSKSTSALKQSVLTKLVGNGFSYEISKRAVDSLIINNKNELELLRKEYDKALRKYEKKYDNYDLRNHIYAYLINKGFRSDDIKEVMEV